MVTEFEVKFKHLLGFRRHTAVRSGLRRHTSPWMYWAQTLERRYPSSSTCVASIEAIFASEGTPVFCEVCPKTLNMSAVDSKSKVTNRDAWPNASLLWGQLLRYGCFDGSRASSMVHNFGSPDKSRQIGTLGDLICFGLDPVKNTACGEGGAVFNNDDSIVEVLVLKRILLRGNTGKYA